MEASPAIQSRLIGAILVEKRLITGEQLERALQLQESSGERLGEIVVAQFGVARLELASVLAEQWAELEQAEREVAVDPGRSAQLVEPSTPSEVQIRRPLGEIFVELGFIDSDQLDAALDAQRVTGARIGEILVEQGSLTRLDLASALAEQWSALQKLRPPTPVVDPQPWQNGSPVAEHSAQELSADDRGVIAELEERLRVVERTAGGTPWQEDLRLVTADLRAAIGTVEKRLDAAGPSADEEELAASVEAVSSRLDVLENVSVSAELDALRQELEGLKTHPVTVEGLADLRTAVERLEGRPDRADELAHLASEITALTSRLDELAGVGELKNKLDAVAGQAEAAQTGIAGLSRRVDDLAGLEGRLDEVAARVPGEAVVDELRKALAELAARPVTEDRSDNGAEIAALVARLDQIAARVEDVATPAPDLTPRIDDLAARVDEVAAAIPVAESDGLAARIESLEEGSRTGNAELERLAAEIDQVGARTQGQLDALVLPEPDLSPVAELRARLDDLAAVQQGHDTAALDELRARVDELATTTAERVADPVAVDELRLRVNLLAATVAREPDNAPLDQIRVRLEELAAVVEQDTAVSALEARVGEVELQLATATQADELREELRQVAESTVAERESLAQALFARVEEITATVPRDDDLAELRTRLDELASRPIEDSVLQARVDEIAARLDGLGAAEGTIADLRESLQALDALRAGDALATGTRLTSLEAAIETLVGLEGRLREGVDHDLAERTTALTSRLDSAESRLDAIVAIEEQVAALATDLKRRPDGNALAGVAAELRAELELLSHRPAFDDPGERLLELSARIDRLARDGKDRIDGLAEQLTDRLDGLAGHDEVAATVAEQAAWIRAELEALRESAEARAVAVDAALVEADDARTTGQHELGSRLDEAIGAIRADLKAKADRFGSQLETQSSETTALSARIEELQEAAADRASFEARLEGMLEQRFDGLAARVTDEVAAARADAEQATAALRGETGSLAARIDELHGMRHLEVQTARAAADDLSARLEGLAVSLHAEAADARAAADGLATHVTTQIGDLQNRRADDLATAELAAAELAARLDDHAVRSAAAAFEVEQALREEMGGIAARLEEQDVQGIEAREELRGELERAASSVGWRLERIEESLAADQTADLKATMAELEHRLEEQVAMGTEQVRVTERALRKGLASLGERIVDTESAYVDAGKALRRSIERLGAAVVEADARMADQIPVSEEEGCVAFVPTAAGYRLVELPGKPPEIGSTLELESCEGPLVVTRYGRSPLPLDNRPCAYLDRA